MSLKCLIFGHTWKPYICFPYRGWFMHIMSCRHCDAKTWWHLDRKHEPEYTVADIEPHLHAVYGAEIDLEKELELRKDAREVIFDPCELFMCVKCEGRRVFADVKKPSRVFIIEKDSEDRKVG